MTDHIRSLATKANAQGTGRIDQTLLLRSLADQLRGSNGFGAFASDTLMKLGLLGTIIGFIIVLALYRHARRGRQGRHEIVHGADERRHGNSHVHDAGGWWLDLVRIEDYTLDAATTGCFSMPLR